MKLRDIRALRNALSKDEYFECVQRYGHAYRTGSDYDRTGLTEHQIRYVDWMRSVPHDEHRIDRLHTMILDGIKR